VTVGLTRESSRRRWWWAHRGALCVIVTTAIAVAVPSGPGRRGEEAQPRFGNGGAGRSRVRILEVADQLQLLLPQLRDRSVATDGGFELILHQFRDRSVATGEGENRGEDLQHDCDGASIQRARQGTVLTG